MIDLSSVQEAAVLRGVGQDDLLELATIAEQREVRQGERLFARGQSSGALYIARGGRFVLTVGLRVLDGEAELPVEELQELDAFGWSALVAPFESIYSAYCIEDGVVLSFPGNELAALMDANPSLGRGLAGNLNVLIGNRVRALQKLWLEEIEQHMDRVQYWTRTEVSRLWSSQHPSQPQRPRRRWMSGFRSAHH